MEALGGHYGIADRDDRAAGSQFWFSVPYCPDSDSGSSANDSSASRHSRSVSRRKLNLSNRFNFADIDMEGMDESVEDKLISPSSRKVHSVLIVEDSLVITKATSRMLVKAGYTVDTAENGAVGLEKMMANFYEFVLMDLQMPIMDGLEATRRLRAFEGDHQADIESGSVTRQFIIGVSANGTDDVRSDALHSGMCDFCSKPFSFQDLCDMRERRLGMDGQCMGE